MAKLCQVVALEKNLKSETAANMTAYHRVCTREDLFNGFSKKYSPKDEDGDQLPPESKKIQTKVVEVTEFVCENLAKLFDVTATKDFGNCEAKADIKVGKKTLAKNVPPTYLLFLEKQLRDLRKFVGSLPILDTNEEWSFDEEASIYKTEATEVLRTKKTAKPIVLYDATDRHPAQTQLINEDIPVGRWQTTKHSGAIPLREKSDLYNRVNDVLDAVVSAREEANSQDVKDQSGVGASIMSYIFGG